MNVDTGELFNLNNEMLEKMGIETITPEELMKQRLIEIEKDMMTEKQSELMQVSKYDNKSNLGRLFLENRNNIRNQMKNRKNK